MEELSIEEKAKAYDEALSVAQETYTTQPMYRDWLVKMFPELVESENERIRQELIEHIKANYVADYVLFKKFSPDDVIAWLEKQGEKLDPDIDVRTMAAWRSGYQAAIDKACEWLKEEYPKAAAYYEHQDSFIDQFRKAMKGD